MNRVGMRSNTVWWLCVVVAASLLASGTLAAGAKQKPKVVAPKVVVPDSSLKVKRTGQSISATELQLIPVDNYFFQAPVFPPLGHQTRDEVDRLRLLNTKKPGALMVAPYPSPVIEGGDELAFRGTRSGDTTFQLDGKPVIPALTRPDSLGPGPRTTVKRKPKVPKPH